MKTNISVKQNFSSRFNFMTQKKEKLAENWPKNNSFNFAFIWAHYCMKQCTNKKQKETKQNQTTTTTTNSRS